MFAKQTLPNNSGPVREIAPEDLNIISGGDFCPDPSTLQPLKPVGYCRPSSS